MTEPVLDALGIRTYILRDPNEAKVLIRRAQTLTIDYKRPIAILLTKDVLGRRRPGE
jgi:sulfopyruvate decarboxylase TPP-binding subunit